jgi:signal transduction histidine kinase/ActR/RegA family two-component response regulator
MMRSTPGLTISLRRLLIVLSAIGLLPLAILGLWSLHMADQYQQREQERAMLDQARALSSAVDAELDGAIATLASMARTPAMDAGELRSYYDAARAQVAAQPEWLAVILTDADGNILFRTTSPFGTPGGRVADPESLKQLLAVQRPLVGRVTLGPRGRAAFPVRVPIRDQAGRLYALTAVIQPDRILRVIERQHAPKGSVIGVFDAAGAVVARSLNQGGTVTRPPSPSLVQLMRDPAPEGVGSTTTLEGETVVSAYTRVSHYGWTVAVGVPTSAVGGAAFQGVTVYGLGLAASLLASIGAAWLLSARVAAAFRSLQGGTAALGAGEGASVAPSRVKEFALMGEAIEAAAARRAAHEAERSRLLASLEDALAASHEASRAKDEFLAMLGHELRNPLSPIVASLDLMDLRGEQSSERERTIMRRQVQHMKRLVDDLLDVSRITTGKMQLDVKPLNLAELVRHAATVRPGMTVELAAPASLWVEGDENRLAQVISNLLSNAERFGNGVVRIGLSAREDWARLEVADQGIGMAPELLARVFEPFYQAPQQLARSTGGLGLGLAIVRKIVELHGGQIRAHSDGPGCGSRFVVELPLAAAAVAAPAAPRAGQAQRQRVLVVDDNVDAATTTSLVLEQLGHEVRLAHTATAALAECIRYQPTVAILDIGLPDMDGYALAAMMRRTASSPRLVALTGYGQQADLGRASEAGFDLHLTKPATLDDLQRAVSTGALAEAAPT